MRRALVAVAIVLLAAAGASPASAHEVAQNPCGVDTHGPGDPTVINPVTGGEYWVSPSYIGVSGSTGYIGVDGANGKVMTTNAAGDSQTNVSSSSQCVIVAGNRVV